MGGQPWNKTPWQENRLIPEARLSGTLYYDPNGELCIDNDSGRFSEYADRTPQHLDNVAKLFQSYGVPVTPQWKEKTDTVAASARRRGRSAAELVRGRRSVAF